MSNENKIWVKVCANTSLEDARMAEEAGADAVGFVFAPSPRRVTAEQATPIVRGLTAGIEKVGVFVGSSFEEIRDTVRACGLTGVQLHSEIGADMAARLRAEFGAGLRILRVVHFGPQASNQAAAVARDSDVDGVLVDSRTAEAVGGTGIAFDWDVAQKTIFSGANTRRMIAAGGLKPENVAEAIAKLRPWGVDVASGVEAAPGRKDPAKVRAFVENARKAAESVTVEPRS